MDYIRAYWCLAECYNEVRERALSIQTAERALRLLDDADPNNSTVQLVHANVESNLGRAFTSLGRYAEALAAAERSLALYERNGDKTGICAMLCNVVDGYINTGQFQKALLLLERAASLCNTSSKCNSKTALDIQFTKGGPCITLGRHAEALVIYQAASKSARELSGPNSADFAKALIGLGNCFHQLDDVQRALEAAMQAVSIFERTGWHETSTFATLQANSGRLFGDIGLPKNALQHFKRALMLRRKLLPPDHPDIASILVCIGTASAALGLSSSADEAFSCALAIERRSQVSCAGPECTRKLREDGAPLDVCVKCRRTCYCSKACQTAD